MGVLLDTHALLWWLSDDEALGEKARSQIAEPDNAIVVSAASLWEIAIKQGLGKMDADLAGTGRFIDALKIPRIAPSLGGVESLVEQPALMSYFELTTEERLAVGIKDNLVRYAVGIEDGADLIADVERALASL